MQKKPLHTGPACFSELYRRSIRGIERMISIDLAGQYMRVNIILLSFYIKLCYSFLGMDWPTYFAVYRTVDLLESQHDCSFWSLINRARRGNRKTIWSSRHETQEKVRGEPQGASNIRQPLSQADSNTCLICNQQQPVSVVNLMNLATVSEQECLVVGN